MNKNFNYINKVMLSCKNEEQLKTWRSWIDNLNLHWIDWYEFEIRYYEMLRYIDERIL